VMTRNRRVKADTRTYKAATGTSYPRSAAN
jgi:hypothetical protein